MNVVPVAVVCFEVHLKISKVKLYLFGKFLHDINLSEQVKKVERHKVKSLAACNRESVCVNFLKKSSDFLYISVISR